MFGNLGGRRLTHPLTAAPIHNKYDLSKGGRTFLYSAITEHVLREIATMRVSFVSNIFMRTSLLGFCLQSLS